MLMFGYQHLFGEVLNGCKLQGFWKQLIDDEISQSELRTSTKIAPSTLAKMHKDEFVSLDVLVRICSALKCQLSDIDLPPVFAHSEC